MTKIHVKYHEHRGNVPLTHHQHHKLFQFPKSIGVKVIWLKLDVLEDSINTRSFTVWGPLRRDYSLSLWRSPDLFPLILCGGPPQVSFFAYYMWAPQVSFFALIVGAPPPPRSIPSHTIWESTHVNFFAYYMGPTPPTNFLFYILYALTLYDLGGGVKAPPPPRNFALTP